MGHVQLQAHVHGQCERPGCLLLADAVPVNPWEWIYKLSSGTRQKVAHPQCAGLVHRLSLFQGPQPWMQHVLGACCALEIQPESAVVHLIVI